ncbi:retrovirus-related Pol polyprotein from transposon 412 [Trichonephila clavipes]|nr:retrovirus-related Pol polyprotein from transposon 412 [Trichonephila clavipes]
MRGSTSSQKEVWIYSKDLPETYLFTQLKSRLVRSIKNVFGVQPPSPLKINPRSKRKFIILPKEKGNRTLLGAYFLSSAALVLDVKNSCWYFWDNPTHKYPFGEELDTPSIVEKMSSNTCQLREGEGESLTSAQKEKLNLLLESFQNVFEPGGEATNILEHHINTGNSSSISVPPYRMSPVKNCPDCIKYETSNQKPSGLLQTPVRAQRFETLAIDLFGPLPESKDCKSWILIIEDCTTKWVELFALPNATAKECAIILIEEVLLRYGIPRHLISDNGTQFVSVEMQQICYLLNIHQSLIPVYHPQANPVERKNRDLKPRLAILVKTNMTVGQRSYPSSALISRQPNAKRQDRRQPF